MPWKDGLNYKRGDSMTVRGIKKLIMRATVAVMLAVTPLTASLSVTGDYAVAEAATVKLASPSVSKKAGTYKNKVTVTIKNKASKGKLYYTTDGKTPTTKPKIYKKALTFKKTTVLKVCCISGSQKSSVVTRKYVIKKSSSSYKPMEEDIYTHSQVEKYINALAYEGKKGLTAEEKLVCQKIEEILSEAIHEGMTTEEKAKTIHDYIIRLNAYDYDNYKNNTIPEESYDVKGVLLKNRSVCQGYAETYYMFMYLLDIPCKIITGGNHAWNLVKLSDGKWYHVDCTWDDLVMESGEQKLDYRYLFMNDEIMLLDHQCKAQDYPVCDGTKYLYYAYGDGKLASINDFADAVRKAYAEGKHELTVLYSEEGLPDLQIIYDITGANRVGYYPPEKLGNYTIFTVVW